MLMNPVKYIITFCPNKRLTDDLLVKFDVSIGNGLNPFFAHCRNLLTLFTLKTIFN